MGKLVSRLGQKLPSNHAELQPYPQYGDTERLNPTEEGDSELADHDRAKTRIYSILIAMSLVVLILNIIQIILIYRFNNYWWTAIAPAIILWALRFSWATSGNTIA